MSLDGVSMFGDDGELGELLVPAAPTNAAGQPLSARPAKPEGLLLNRDEGAWEVVRGGRVVEHVTCALGLDEAARWLVGRAFRGESIDEVRTWLREAPSWP